MLDDLADLGWDIPVRDYINALKAEVLRLTGRVAYLEGLEASRPHGLRKKPLVGLGDGGGQGLPPARDDGALGVVEDLDDPPGPLGAEAVEVQAEPEGLLDAAGVERGEEFGGSYVDGPGGHVPPLADAHPHTLTWAVSGIRMELEEAYAADLEEAVKRLEGNDFAVLARIKNRWQNIALREMEHRILMRLSGPRFAS